MIWKQIIFIYFYRQKIIKGDTMCTFEDFISYTDFKQFLEAGEVLNLNSIEKIPIEYYKDVRIWFEESVTINKNYKTKIMQISFNDGDIVSYIFKYNQIFKVKTYRLTNIPYSKNNNKFHIIQVLDTLFSVMPYTTIMMSDEECKLYDIHASKKLFLPGYENYWYEYENLLNKIQQHKHENYQLRKFMKHAKLEYYNKITPELKERILNIFNIWFEHHPAPDRGTREHVEQAINQLPHIFIVTYNNKDISCHLSSFTHNKNNIYFASGYIFDLSRCGYHNCTLLSNLLITQYIKNQFNIDKYYIGGYVPDNRGLKNYKEVWATNKITYYGINSDYLELIKKHIMGDDYEELLFM